MTDENLAALKRLELIHEYIYNECEGNIFYPPEHNRVIFLRIKNAADMLLNKAVKILKQQRLPHYDNSGELSVNTIDQIMMLIIIRLRSRIYPIILSGKYVMLSCSLVLIPMICCVCTRGSRIESPFLNVSSDA